MKGIALTMRSNLFPYEEVTFEEFNIFLKKHKTQLQTNLIMQIKLEAHLSKEEQSIIEFLASSFLNLLNELNENKSRTDLDNLLNKWIQMYSMHFNYYYLYQFYFIFEKALANLLKKSTAVEDFSIMLYLPVIASKISSLFSNCKNSIPISNDFHLDTSQRLLLSYLELFPIQQLYLVRHTHLASPVLLNWRRTEEGAIQREPFRPKFDRNITHLNELTQQSFILQFSEASLYLYPKTVLEKEHEASIKHFLSQLHELSGNNVKQENTLLKKLNILDAFNKVLLTSSRRNDFLKIIKACEELLNYKRCVFYAYIPWSNEFKGIMGEELSKVQKTQGYVYPNQLFHTMIITKKPIFIKNPTHSVKTKTIELFNLSSLIVAPICHNEEVLGWMTLDQVGEEFDSTQEDLLLIEEICSRIGLFLKNFDDNLSPGHNIELTDRELSVLALLAEGYDNKKMGEFLHLSEHTVRDYIGSLMIKLKAKNRTQVVSVGFRLGLLS